MSRHVECYMFLNTCFFIHALRGYPVMQRRSSLNTLPVPGSPQSAYAS